MLKRIWKTLLETLYAFIPGLKGKDYFVKERDGWYFYDETWNLVGPYASRNEAAQALREYAKKL